MARFSLLALLLLLTACAQVPDSSVHGTAAAKPVNASVRPPMGLPPRHHSADAEDDGSGTMSPFDTRDTEIANLDPALLHAVQQAALASRSDGVPFWITSGWRSRAHQQRLLDEAVQKYGSLSEALHWVSTPDTSAHVRGDAVDVGPTQADSWLEQHGARWGLCRMFANEIWHFELATDPGGSCPAMFANSSERQ
jgi:zinc D-Ala-D-Ala carboxypeptidase